MNKSRVYYNENNKHTIAWLRNLIAADEIAPGDVDERDIRDVKPDDLRGYTQCHFFAGIGGWSLAFRLADWPDDRVGWSASCPCPPWSRARIWHREREGKNDERDLWPAFFPLVKACRPPVLFGEQVSGKKVKPWIERTRSDLEEDDYHFVGGDRRARDYGSPQGRERFYFSADLGGARRQGLVAGDRISKTRPWRWRGEADLRAIADAPFEPGDRWPQPLIRRGDDGFPGRVANLRAYGNAIDPWIAADEIRAYLDDEALAARSTLTVAKLLG